MKLSQSNFEILSDAIYYLKVGELKKNCERLDLSLSGSKGDLITKILAFVKDGTRVPDPVIPNKSLAKNYPPQPLKSNALMLSGGYKNDAKTRAFFKTLIGPHFHYTAFGVDWLDERWLQGKPPTYQEYADMWVAETARRKGKKPEPKQEWAYINFLQRAEKEMPKATKDELMKVWKKLREEKVQLVKKLL